MHPLEAASNFNESMYFNLFDHEQKLGLWLRLGNRPNEGHAEMSCCVYLPDGRIGFMYQRPDIDHNNSFDAAGMQFEVINPMQALNARYHGMLCLLGDPQQMLNPGKAFSSNPIVSANIDLRFTALAPAFGGEPVDEHGKAIEQDPETSFARGHYEQHMQGVGEITVGNQSLRINGFGLRDHSWGPRYWQNIHWYRWLPLVFNQDLAMMLSIVTLRNGHSVNWGMVMRRDSDGAVINDPVTSIQLNSEYDDQYQAQAQTARIVTEAGVEYELQGQALSSIPLRNRRKDSEGNSLHTRITEAMTRFTCNGQTGFGMAEYLDQMIDNKPVGYPQ
ncbi:MAG: DUF7064 domain-containing protein [Nevskiales bacterium]